MEHEANGIATTLDLSFFQSKSQDANNAFTSRQEWQELIILRWRWPRCRPHSTLLALVWGLLCDFSLGRKCRSQPFHPEQERTSCQSKLQGGYACLLHLNFCPPPKIEVQRQPLWHLHFQYFHFDLPLARVFCMCFHLWSREPRLRWGFLLIGNGPRVGHSFRELGAANRSCETPMHWLNLGAWGGGNTWVACWWLWREERFPPRLWFSPQM